jgi:gluconate 2-dehydrogenase alpha chain
MKTLPAVDVVIVGGGWTGLLMAKELSSRTSLSIAVLERGGPRKTADYVEGMDELDYKVRRPLVQDYSQETVTFRHSANERALPVRQYGSFLPGTGVGGAGEHWGGVCERMSPDGFELRSETVRKYGPKKLPEDHLAQDWGVTYDEIEPYYTRAEQLIGASGKAGNLRGKRIAGGNIFEGWRSTEYPTPPTKLGYVSVKFRDAAQSLGYHPFPVPAATLSETYTNPDGVSRPGCVYCGYCESYGCMIGAKAQPTNTLLPVIEQHKSVTIRTRASVRRILHDGAGHGRARGVSFIDAEGEEVIQPADLVILASWTVNNTRLLLLSGLGEPYDPATDKGTVGRNLTHQVVFPAATAFFETPLNRFMGSGASGIMVADLDAHVLDQSSLPFWGGGIFEVTNQGFQPIGNFGVVPESVKTRWGSEWKKAAIHYYDSTARITFLGRHLAYRDNYIDLDPTYKDHNGDPLARMTLDWRENERRMAEFMIPKGVEMARAMGAKEVTPFRGLEAHYDTRRYQSTHLLGGTILGTSPERSVVNPYSQQWQLANLFVIGGSIFPQNASGHPTMTILAQTLRTADAVVDRYLKRPGPLV